MTKLKYQLGLQTLEKRSSRFEPEESGCEQWLDNRHESDTRYWDVKLALVELTGVEAEEFHRIPFLDRLRQVSYWPEIWQRYNDYLELLLAEAFPSEYVSPTTIPYFWNET